MAGGGRRKERRGEGRVDRECCEQRSFASQRTAAHAGAGRSGRAMAGTREDLAADRGRSKEEFWLGREIRAGAATVRLHGEPGEQGEQAAGAAGSWGQAAAMDAGTQSMRRKKPLG
jgi:hypothetical protein